ncbi:MAG TPA: HD domain-containing phosphohydrolase [Vicinamibacterales bacterium]
MASATTDIVLHEHLVWPAPPPFRVERNDRPAAEGRFDDVIAAGVLLEVSRIVSRILAVARPDIGERTERIVGFSRELVHALALNRAWEFEVAARLSQIGWLAMPDAIREAALRGDPMSEEDCLLAASHPLLARDIIGAGGRLSGVVQMIERQREPRCLPGEPVTDLSRDRIALGAQILRVSSDLETLLRSGLSRAEALARMAALPCEYDAALVAALAGAPDDRRQAA